MIKRLILASSFPALLLATCLAIVSPAQQKPSPATATQNQAANTSTLVLQLRDSKTGYGVAGKIRVDASGAQPTTAPIEQGNADASGKLALQLPPGKYVVEITAPGYSPANSDLVMAAGQNAQLAWVLDPTSEPTDLKRAESMVRQGSIVYAGYVVDSGTFRPVAGAQIRDRNSGAEATTNARGFFALQMPVKHSPADTCQDTIGWFSVTAPGYKQTVRKNVELYDNNVSFANFDLTRGTGTIDQSAPDVWDETASSVAGAKDSHPSTPAWWDAEPSRSPPSKEVKQWQALIPKIEKTLQEHGIQCPGQSLKIGIVDSAQLDDGPNETLLDYCPGGAYTDWILAMQLQDGEPVLSKYYPNPDKPENLEFAQGASVMNTADVRLAPQDNAIYDIQYGTDGCTHLLRCRVNAYVWAADTLTFELDRPLSRKATQGYCRHVQEALLKTGGKNPPAPSPPKN